MKCDICIGCFFLFHLIVGVEESIVNALYTLRITDQLFKSYVLHEWCVHNRLFNAYYDVKLKKNTRYNRLVLMELDTSSAHPNILHTLY
jgi:hypothetical protein